MKNSSKPANPLRGADGALLRLDDGYIEQCGHTLATGISKREHFAAMAMQGLLVNMGRNEFNDFDAVALASIEASNALLKALEQ